MPVRIGFSRQRRLLLDAELQRISEEIARYGIERAFLSGDFALGRVTPATELELVIVQRSDQPFVSRPDFFSSHLSQRVGLQTYVYTPEEFESLSDTNTVLKRALSIGEEIVVI